MNKIPNVGYVFVATKDDIEYEVVDFKSRYENSPLEKGQNVGVNRGNVATKIKDEDGNVIFVFAEEDIIYIQKDSDEKELLTE